METLTSLKNTKKPKNKYIKEGYVRNMTKEETINTLGKTWHLPHHPVFHPQKPGKVRVVFDTAEKI